MKRIMMSGVITFAVTLLAPQILHAQGTITYLSNLNEASAGSLAVGSNTWLAAPFRTGTNASGYVLDSVQLEMTVASGNPSNFTAMLYGNGNHPGGFSLGSSIGTLTGSLDPVTGGIFTYTPALNITLSPNTLYSIVLTAGTAVANGAYEWSYVAPSSYNPIGGWINNAGVLTSSDGSAWSVTVADFPQYAVNAMPIPEPGVLDLFSLGGLGFLWHRRKSKTV